MAVIENAMHMFHFTEVYNRKTNMFFEENDVAGTYHCKKNKLMIKYN